MPWEKIFFNVFPFLKCKLSVPKLLNQVSSWGCYTEAQERCHFRFLKSLWVKLDTLNVVFDHQYPIWSQTAQFSDNPFWSSKGHTERPLTFLDLDTQLLFTICFLFSTVSVSVEWYTKFDRSFRLTRLALIH